MPHIEIKCYPGRTEEQKKELANKIVEDVAEIFKSSPSSVSVSIVEVEPKKWKDDVFDKEIKNSETLYVKPGYTCE